MDGTLLSLISYLMEKPDTKVVVFGKTLIPMSLKRLAGTVAAVVARGDTSAETRDSSEMVYDWTNGCEWRDSIAQCLGGSGGAVAVFVANCYDVPIETIGHLRAIGFSELIYLEYGQWSCIAIQSRGLGLQIKARRLIDGLKARWNTLLNRVAKIIRKIVLKQHAVDLRNWFPSSYIQEGRQGFRAHIPQLRHSFDTVGVVRDEYALFEEQSRLYAHQPLADVQEFGGGACSLWEENVFFSTTDGSDANTNGRRYRLVNLTKLGIIRRGVLWATSRLDVEFLRFNSSETNAVDVGMPGTSAKRLPHIGKPLRRVKVLDVWKDESFVLRPRGVLLSGYVPGRIVNYVGSLGAGGTERQLSYLATSCCSKNLDVRVALPKPVGANVDFNLHYKQDLQAGGVQVDLLDDEIQDRLLSSHKIDRNGVEELCVINSLPSDLRSQVGQFYSYLLETKPQVVHCWLDYANCTGGLAALLAGVPQVILSFRSVNPTNFPHLHQEWFLPWYRLILRSERVTMIANSKEGARSYAEWIGCDENRITVIHNGLDTAAFKVPSLGEVASLRESARIPRGAPVIAGVFRFTAEKRPLRFLRIVSDVLKKVPDLHVLVAGEGPLVGQFRREVQNLDVADRVHMLGRRRDVPTIISAADVLLLTSNMEGLPNVLMEAQWFGRPVVAPRVGGIPEVVIEGESAYLFEKNNVDEAVSACVRLLTNSGLREEMARKGAEFVQGAFSLQAMLEKSIDVYQRQARDLELPDIEPTEQSARIAAGRV